MDEMDKRNLTRRVAMSLFLIFSLSTFHIVAQDEAALYPVPEESKPKEGVTYGEWVKGTLYGSGVQENFEYGELVSVGYTDHRFY